MKFKFLGRLRDDDDDEESPAPRGGRGGPPVDEVQELTDQGYSESEITETLRERGYAYGEINEAMNQAVRESASEYEPGSGQEYGDRGGGGFREYDDGPGYDDAPRDPPAGGAEQPPRQSPQGYGEGYEEGGEGAAGISAQEEELIEVIVSEQFTEVEEEFNAVYGEIDELREELENLRDRIEELEIRKDENQQQFMQRLNDVEEYFEQTNERIGGMEKAFQQVLPSLVENTRELSTLVRGMKDEE